ASAGQRLKSAQPESGARGGPPFEPQAKLLNSSDDGCAAIGAPSTRSQMVARRNACSAAAAGTHNIAKPRIAAARMAPPCGLIVACMAGDANLGVDRVTSSR